MTLDKFKLLSEDQQTEVIWSDGAFVAERQEADSVILLYQLYSFYVEIWCVGAAHKFKIHRSFGSTKQLKPYLEKIDISSLIAV